MSEGEGVDFGEITVYVTKGDVCSVKVNGVGGTQTLLALFFFFSMVLLAG